MGDRGFVQREVERLNALIIAQRERLRQALLRNPQGNRINRVIIDGQLANIDDEIANIQREINISIMNNNFVRQQLFDCLENELPDIQQALNYYRDEYYIIRQKVLRSITMKALFYKSRGLKINFDDMTDEQKLDFGLKYDEKYK